MLGLIEQDFDIVEPADFVVSKNTREFLGILSRRCQFRKTRVCIISVGDKQSIFSAHCFLLRASVSSSLCNSSVDPSKSIISLPTLPLNLIVRPCPRAAQA